MYIAAIALIAMTFSLVVGLGQSVWFDEAYSILLSRESIERLISLTAVDAHPPFYYLYLKAWAGLFGYGELSLRLSSIVPFGFSVVGILLVLRQFFSQKVVMLAGLGLLIAPFLLRYGYEIRMYALVIAIGVWATYVLVKARQSRDKKWWVIYSLLVALGMYTLYMSAVFWLWHLVWMTIEQYKKSSKFLVPKALFAYAGAVLLFLPWSATVIDQLRHNVLPEATSAVTLGQLVHLASMLLVYVPGYETGGWLSLVIVAVIVSVVYIMIKLWPKLSLKQKAGYRLVFLGWLVSLVFFALISLPPQPPRFMERYIVLGAMAFYLTMSLSAVLALQQKNLRKIGSMLAVLLVVLGIIGNYNMATLGNFNFQRMQRPYAGEILSKISGCDNTVVVVRGPYDFIDTSYYLKSCDVRFYQEYNPDFRGGYAMLHDSPLGVTNLKELSSDRVAVIDPHEQMGVSGYQKTAEYEIENVDVREYSRQ